MASSFEITIGIQEGVESNSQDGPQPGLQCQCPCSLSPEDFSNHRYWPFAKPIPGVNWHLLVPKISIQEEFWFWAQGEKYSQPSHPPRLPATLGLIL